MCSRSGIPVEDKERIFSKGYGKNTGPGLFLVREILAMTGITIQETGVPGKGARFEMTIPERAWMVREAASWVMATPGLVGVAG